jgi:hypothetical protein
MSSVRRLFLLVLFLPPCLGAHADPAPALPAPPMPGDAASASTPAQFVAPTVVATRAPTPAPSPTPSLHPRLSLGVGYPDLRLRGNPIGDLDLEFKFASLDSIQSYGLRLYVPLWKQGPQFSFYTGAEGAYVHFDNINTVSGDGWTGSFFVGVQYRFAKRWSLGLDLGPSVAAVSSSSDSVVRMDWVGNAGVYFDLF